MDGMSGVVPKHIIQLYTIHGNIGYDDKREIWPLLYALMSNKTEKSYNILFNYIKSSSKSKRILNMPKHIITYFEKAAINASKKIFPEFKHHCCYFHLSQSIYNRVRDEGLYSKLGENKTFQQEIKKLQALAFFPSNEIPKLFKFLTIIITEEIFELTMSIYKYFC